MPRTAALDPALSNPAPLAAALQTGGMNACSAAAPAQARSLRSACKDFGSPAPARKKTAQAFWPRLGGNGFPPLWPRSVTLATRLVQGAPAGQADAASSQREAGPCLRPSTTRCDAVGPRSGTLDPLPAAPPPTCLPLVAPPAPSRIDSECSEQIRPLRLIFLPPKLQRRPRPARSLREPDLSDPAAKAAAAVGERQLGRRN